MRPLGIADRLKKRALDLCLCVPALLLLSPLLVAIAVAIKVDSPGPILFRQRRIGQANRTFCVLKFRSMRLDVCDATASCLTTARDPRVTRVGRFIRRTSLDELPQLFNVLRGEMSLVGPRPHAAGAKAGEYPYWEVHPQYWCRGAIKPGLTGLAQVRGYRGPTDTHQQLIDRVDSDLEYLVDWTVWRDLALIARTVRVIAHANAF
jgi:lipopolysaccharide/colanic/teichoic acid biosynthesis glycosyltransferase